MGLNWLEDIGAHYYQLQGYLVIQNEDLPMPKTDYRGVRGHSDIDIIAIKNNEVLHVECQSWWGPSKIQEEKDLRRLGDRFNEAPNIIFEKYGFLDRKKVTLRNIFITSGKPKGGSEKGPWGRLSNYCNKYKIELLEVNTIIELLIKELRTTYPSNAVVGKEKGPTKLLLHLIHNGYIKD